MPLFYIPCSALRSVLKAANAWVLPRSIYLGAAPNGIVGFVECVLSFLIMRTTQTPFVPQVSRSNSFTDSTMSSVEWFMHAASEAASEASFAAASVATEVVEQTGRGLSLDRGAENEARKQRAAARRAEKKAGEHALKRKRGSGACFGSWGHGHLCFLAVSVYPPRTFLIPPSLNWSVAVQRRRGKPQFATPTK